MVAGILICAITLMPEITIAFIALTPEQNTWPHLLANVLPGTTLTSMILMGSVGLMTFMIGTGTAWLVTMCRFPGRAILEKLLVAPLATPTYIGAYCYVEAFDYTGPLQNGLRNLFGWRDATDYWFPEIRSLGGAIFVMSITLYPYVYLTARAAFLTLPSGLLDVSRTLGRSARASFFSIILPLARPGLIVGVTLAMMETINDIGAVQFFGVRTLTLGIYSAWLGRGDLPGGAQLSCVLLLIVLALIWIERRSRQHQRMHRTNGTRPPLPSFPLTGWQKWMASGACTLPIILGLAIPLAVLVSDALPRLSLATLTTYMTYARNSVVTSAMASVLTLTIALILVYAYRLIRHRGFRSLILLANIGYAVPGTVLAIGILTGLATLDNALDNQARSMFGVSTGLLFSGTVFAMLSAYVIRFLAIAYSSIETGMNALSPHPPMAARTLGCPAGKTLLKIQLPSIRPALITAALLVFVDSVKELPATILLRPFNFETLATHVYSYASLERFEDASLAALTIVLIGLTPAIFINRIMQIVFRPTPHSQP